MGCLARRQDTCGLWALTGLDAGRPGGWLPGLLPKILGRTPMIAVAEGAKRVDHLAALQDRACMHAEDCKGNHAHL